MIARPLPDDVGSLLRKHGLDDAPDEHKRALADRIRWAQCNRRTSPPVLTSRQRQRCATAARRVMRHREQPPRDPAATERALMTLAGNLDSLAAVVRMARDPVGFDVGPLVETLRNGAPPDAGVLQAFIEAVERLPDGEGAPPPKEGHAVIRSGITTWRAIHGSGGYWYGDKESNKPGIHGPLPRFLSDLLLLAGLDVPSADVMHAHLKNL